MERALITACSNKFFPSLINLLTSIKINYPNHPTIFVYDLGLLPNFRKEIELIKNVKILSIPHFCNHWRSCYTWKTYIFTKPLADLNFYLDAGCEVLMPLDDIFTEVNETNVFFVDQGRVFEKIIPVSFQEIFDFNNFKSEENVFAAGIIGFKNDFIINEIFNKVFQAAKAGLTLGFSLKDKWRNKGKDKNIFIRDCELFRHDLTLLNIFFKKYFNKKIKININKDFDDNINYEKYIKQIRLNYFYLDNLQINKLHNKNKFLYVFNRFIIFFIIFLKNIKRYLKKINNYVFTP